MTLRAELAALVGEENALYGDAVGPYVVDASEVQGISGAAEAVVFPQDTAGVAAVMAWAAEHDVPVTPRGGGTGYSGGAVPQGGIVLAMDRLRRVRELEPLLWRAEVEAGVTTHQLQRLAAENGLYYPVDPGAAEQSQIGGNVATNAGGPHAFKYGVTDAWVTGLEAVLPSGEVIRVGGKQRKDVAGYDLASLLAGSEGTLAVITSVSLRLIPAVEARCPVVGFFDDLSAGCEAVTAAMASGIVPAAIEYLDGRAVSATAAALPGRVPDRTKICVIAEADGSRAEAESGRELLIEALAPSASALHAPTDPEDVQALWRWRDGVGIAVAAELGGKVSDDIAVPLDRLEEAIAGTLAIGRRHELDACSWGHAGDGNLHSTFMLDRREPEAVKRAERAAEELFALAIDLEGTISGEHGIGLTKAGHLRSQWTDPAVRLHLALKQLFDPEGRLNPGKKMP